MTHQKIEQTSPYTPFKKQDNMSVRGRYGIAYKVVPHSALDAHIIKNGIYGDWIASQDLIEIAKDAVIFDIGANAGFLSLIFAKRYAPDGAVYAYEPDPAIFDRLQENLAVNDGIKNLFLNQVALQDDPDKMTSTLNIRRAIDDDADENCGLSSLLNISLHTVDRVTVKVSTLDKEVSRLALQRLDFIKIDVEGFETKVLAGGRNSILRFKPAILWEFSRVIDKLSGTQNSTQSFLYLAKLGYHHFAISEITGLKAVSSADDITTDVNILSFHQEKLPENLRV
jgi:FkbM family methyltransferase